MTRVQITARVRVTVTVTVTVRGGAFMSNESGTERHRRRKFRCTVSL